MKILNLIASEHVTNEIKAKNISELVFNECELYHHGINDFSIELSALEDKDYIIFSLSPDAVSNAHLRDGLLGLLKRKHSFIYCPPFYSDKTNTHNENYDLSDIAIVSCDIKNEKLSSEIAEIFTLDGLILNAEKLQNYASENDQKSSLSLKDVLAFVKFSIKQNDFMFRRAALFTSEKRLLLGSKNPEQECIKHKLQTLKTHHENYLYFFPKLKLNLGDLEVHKNKFSLLYLSRYFSGYGTPEISIAHRDVISIIHYNLIWHLVRGGHTKHTNLAIKLAKKFDEEKTVYSARPELNIIHKFLVSETPKLASEVFNETSKDLAKTVRNNIEAIEILFDSIYDMNRVSELSNETMLNLFFDDTVKQTERQNQKGTIKTSLKQLFQSIKVSFLYRLSRKERE